VTATRQDIQDFIRRGQEEGARWVIVAVDRFDHENYPIFVKEDEDFWAKWPDGCNMQGVDEVYDLELPIDEQLAEFRARHEPPRPQKDTL
jgi:hypothetical protein